MTSYKSYPVIRTPRGSIVVGKDMTARLTWNPFFTSKWQGRTTAAQRFVDNQVYRLSEPYTPKLTGMLILSGNLGTEFGSGLVQWIAPYSVYQYYSDRRPGSLTGPLRGPFWFERMKAVHGDAIIAGAQSLVARGIQ